MDLAAACGLVLDPWQELVLLNSCVEDGDRWLTPDVAVVCSRQNGKNAILEARLLAALFLFPWERKIIHTAHLMNAAATTFNRLVGYISTVPDLQRRVRSISRSKGGEGIFLHDGTELLFMARSSGSGRSMSVDLLILDEAYNLPVANMNAITPTMAARPRTQTWFTSSAVNQLEHPHGLTLSRIRRRGLAHGPGLAYAEWSGDEVAFEKMSPTEKRAYVTDPAVHAIANPGYGVRVRPEFLEGQISKLGVRGFATEHLSIGDWTPEPEEERERVVDPKLWDELVDQMSRIVTPRKVFAITVADDASKATISICGGNADGIPHIEVVDERGGVAWVVDRAVELKTKWRPVGFVMDPGSAAGQLVDPLKLAGVKILPVTAREYAQACGRFKTAATERSDEQPRGAIRHRDDPRVNNALDAATVRPLMGSWAWAFDTPPALTGVTLALHGYIVGPTSTSSWGFFD